MIHPQFKSMSLRFRSHSIADKGALIILLLILGSSISLLKGQSVSVKSSESINLRLAEAYLEVVGNSERGYYLLRARLQDDIISTFSNATLQLDHYRKNLKHSKTVSISDLELEVRARCSKSFEFTEQDNEGNVFVYYSELDKIKKRNTLYRSKLNLSSGKLGRGKVVSNIDIPKNRCDYRGGYEIFYSPDKSKKAIIAIGVGPDRFSMLANILLLDSENNTLWEKEVYLPRTVERRILKFKKLNNLGIGPPILSDHSIVLTNNGNVHMLFKSLKGLGKRYDYHFYSSIPGSQLMRSKIIDPPSDEMQITDATIFAGPNGNIRFHGFYGDQINQIIEGTFTYEINSENQKVLNKKTYAFDNDDKHDILISKDARQYNWDRRISKRLKAGKEQELLNQNIIQVIQSIHL